MRSLWSLSPDHTFLNHGSFGGCPVAVVAHRQELLRRMEIAPTHFLIRELPTLLSEARGTLARFLGAEQSGFVFVRNATEGVNSVLASFPLQAGDEVLTTALGYPACNRASARWCTERGASVVVAPLRWPVAHPGEVLDALNGSVTKQTRLLLIDHVTSSTGLVFPLETILDWARERGLPVLVDGAHGPGMLTMELEAWGRKGLTFYTGNFHKWCCSPRGAAFLWVHPEWSQRIQPLTTSHGVPAPGDSTLAAEFDWTGTADYTPWIAAAYAVDYLERLLPGGWREIQRRNRTLVEQGAAIVDAVLRSGIAPHPEMRGCLWSLPIQATPTLGTRLWQEDHLDLFINPISPGSDRHILRLSAHLYNSIEDYEKLAEALKRDLVF